MRKKENADRFDIMIYLIANEIEMKPSYFFGLFSVIILEQC